MDRIQDQLVALAHPRQGLAVVRLPQRPREFQPYLLVGNADRVLRLVIGQIPQVHEHRQRRVPGIVGQVVVVIQRIDLEGYASHEGDDRLAQAVHVPPDEVEQVVRRRGPGPVGIEFPAFYGAHHRIRIVNRTDPLQFIAVVPPLHIGKVDAVLPAQAADLILRKAHVFGERPGAQHRIFPEIRERRLGPQLLDRQYARHVDRRKQLGRRRAALEQHPQEQQIFSPHLIAELSDRHIPFVDDHDETPAGPFDDAHKRFVEGVADANVGIRDQQFPSDGVHEERNKALRFRLSLDVRHVEIDYIVAVQMRFIVLLRRYFHQAGLIDISGFDGACKCAVSRIQISSHRPTSQRSLQL